MKPRSTAAVATVAAVLALGLGYTLRAARADGIPAKGALSYAGVLEDANGPVNGPHNIGVSLYGAATGGMALCEAPSAQVSVVGGHFSVALPDACTTIVHASADVWVDVLVDGSDTGRTKIGAVPYAAEAAHAVEATHAAAADTATGALVAVDKVDAVPGDPWYTNCNSSMGSSAGFCGLMAHYTCINHGYKSGWFEGDSANGHWGIVCVK
jgi:hypothetical protein